MYLTGDFGRIEIAILSRSNSDDYWDGNWMDCNIQIDIALFTANYNYNLRTDEFALFNTEITALLSGDKTEAQFSSMEDGLWLSFEKDITGCFIVKGEANSTVNYKISLLFEFTIDFLQMERLQKDVNDILQTYPVVGSPRKLD